MLPNGTGSRVVQRAKAAKVKAKARERKVATIIAAMPNLCATIGARGMGTAATPPPATSLTTDLKEERKGRNEKKEGRSNVITG